MKRLFLLCLLLTSAAAQAEDEGASTTMQNAFSPKRGATELVVKTVEAATQSVCVAAYSFTSEPIANALLAAKARGVAVKVTLDKSQARGKSSILPQLQQSGLPVRINKHYAIMHDKFMVIDEKVLQLGSFNYTKSAETKNAENVLVIRKYKKVIAAYATECDRLWDEAINPEQFEAEAQTRLQAKAQKKAKPKPTAPSVSPRVPPKPAEDIATPPIVNFP